MKRKRSVILAVLLLVLSLPVSVGAAPASNGVTLETEHFREFDITLPEALAEKYRWEETGFEGTNVLNFYDRGLYDATDETAISAQTRGYRFSISQYYYDSDYCGMADLEPHEMFQSSLNRIVAFYRQDGVPQQPMILSVGYTLAPSAETERDVLEIVGCMTPKSDIRLEDIDANPWNVKFANFLLNGQFRTAGQEYFDKIERQACLYNVAGNNYPELIITNGASGYAVAAYVYTLNANGQVEYLRTATEAELGAMPMQSFSSIYSTGWGDFLTACGYQMQYLGGADDTAGWCGVYRYDDGNQGEQFIVRESNDVEVRGTYMFAYESGGYGERDFVWSKEDSHTASEPFQNGIGSIYYHLESDRIVVDYPDGWWADRDYMWVSNVGCREDEEAAGTPVSYGGASVDFKESLFEKSAYVYDNELATFGAMLCMAAGRGEQEICQLFYQLGIEDANIENFNYGGENAFSIAHLPIRLNGEEMNLMFIVVRGSVVDREFIGDHFAKANREFLGYMVYDYVEDFEKKVWEAVKEYANGHEDLYDKPRTFFITGHSLGGATANLITALANNPETGNSWIFMDTDVSRIFTYTYGAIDSIKVDAPVTTGYQNIHNIYNFFDTYGPNGRDTLSAAGNSMYGKFGHMDRFAYRFSWENDLETSKNHIIDNYLRAIVEGAVSCESPYSYWEVHCPVDVEVLKDGAVVGRIVDNQVDEALLAAYPEVALMVVENSKHIGVFDSPEAYSLRITATDDGEMSVSTMSFDETGEGYGAAEYPDVALKAGQVFSVELPDPNLADGKEQTPELLVMDGNRISGRVNADGSISPIRKSGNVAQYLLLAVIVLAGVALAFLGGKKMEETKKLKFPVASIFTVFVIAGMAMDLYIYLTRPYKFDDRIGYRILVEFGGTYTPLHLIYQALLIGSMVLLVVLLFMRKRNGLLAGALAVQALLPAFSLVSFLINSGSRGFFEAFEYEPFGPVMWAIGICGSYALKLLCYLLLTLMAVTPCAEAGARGSGLQRLWFVPGILSIFISFADFVGSGYFVYSAPYIIVILFQIPMAFLLGRWLTHPYKKEKPVYVPQPYLPVYPNVAMPQAAQRVFCTGCGKALALDEKFCSACGKERPTPVASAQPTYQQPVYPQMGYVQDAPSGGMMALGFFFPIVGLILYLVWKDQTPLKAKSAGKGALIGFIVGMALSILVPILTFVIVMLTA